ncbi:MAG: hypothetical protein GY757_36945 [bacterium]|nr:hypothetical protein [bacterium]
MSETKGAQLFSIDVDAHLNKAAAHTFGSASHYPVELVRAAIGRGAGVVEVHISRNQVRVIDDGKGIDAASLETLMCLLTPSQPEALKEEAVEAVQTRKGYGLLALFAPSPLKISIENVSSKGKTRIVSQRGKVKTSYDCTILCGTSITLITATHRDIAREKHILTVYCRSVSREIRLNNRLISRSPRLSDQMASLEMTRSELIPTGSIGVPHKGDLIRIRLMDREIPYRFVTLPPYKGYLYDSVIEFTGDINREIREHLSGYAFRLYKWLCTKYATTTPGIQARIEELVFAHCKSTGDTSLLSHFAPFKEYRSSQRYSLPQIIRETADSQVFAVSSKREWQRYNTFGKVVLSLTREQADFLINSRNIPIHFLPPVFRREKRLRGLLFKLGVAFRRMVLFFLPRPFKRSVLSQSQLTPGEVVFLQGINRYLSGQDNRLLSIDRGMEAVMIASRGPFPSLSGVKKKSPGSRYLYIRRNHSLVKRAVAEVQKNPHNIEIFLPLLLPG